jgi:hypothetical protein
METLTRLVTDSLIRHGFDRPVDPRRLQWSQWFRCDSPHSLLAVPSKPGIFALAEEIYGAADAPVRRAERSEGRAGAEGIAPTTSQETAASAAEGNGHLLAVLQFSEAHDMAFTLDRMFTRPNPLRGHLATGRCFLRFVVLEDPEQRRTICATLSQWLLSSAEKAVGRTLLSVSAKDSTKLVEKANPKADLSHLPLDSGAGRNLHCPHPLPSGF